jgi:hypothetical protein
MIEDLLTREERIRLEALNQANQTYLTNPTVSDEMRIMRATKFEKYIREGVDEE